MSRLHQAWESIPLEGDLQLITADRVRELTGREPRLMMKFDHTHLLPPVLKQSGRFILPLKNGLYAILKGEGYHQPESCGPVLDFPRRTHFELKTTGAGISEMQHLDIAFNTGLLSHFLEEPVLYPTIRGRKRSPHFHFRVGPHELEAQGVQVEIDGGFEGRKSVTLVEAKIGECEDFHLRQLYYPYRFWSAHTQKSIRPVFFTYQPETEIYRFREYRFSPPEVYGAPELVAAAAYQIVKAEDTETLPLTGAGEFPFPQADKLEKVALIPFLVAEGHKSCETLSEIFEFSPRQGRYYLDACRALGFLDGEGELTEAGSDYIACPPEIRYRLLCHSVLKLPVIQDILATLILAPSRALSREGMEAVVQRTTSLAPATARRRTQTVWSWLQWVSNYTPYLYLTSTEIRLGAEVKSQEPEQLGLF